VEELTFLNVPQHTWQFINTFAPWFSAIGTFCAVVVSLYLAFRKPRARARVSCGLRLIVQPGTKGPFPEFLQIRVVNLGDRSLRITGVGWKWGLFKKRFAVQMTENPPVNSPLPVELDHGQEASWLVPMSARDEPWMTYFARGMLMPSWRVSLATLRVQAYSSVGVTFKARPESNLIDKLREACRDLSRQPQA
jgi:hypothetical protein